MKLTIMMPVFNEEKYIAETLRSLLRQKEAADLDIIVVNDGSSDNTREILEQVAAANPEVRVINIENGGVTRARNIALDHLGDDADFVSFIDGDDLSPLGRFTRDLKFFEKDDDLEVVYATLRLFEFSDPETLEPSKESRTVDVRGIQLAAGLYRHSLIKKVGRFDEDFTQSEDTDYLLRLFEQQPKYIATDDIGSFYRRHENNMTKDRKTAVRDFSRALLKSAKRRRLLDDYQMPSDVFEVKQLHQIYEWE